MVTSADRDFIQSLDHGLAVLEAFSANRQSLTVSQAAEACARPPRRSVTPAGT